jgi:hypothetical protein
MKSDADAISKGGYNIYRNPALLTLFYNAWKLDEVSQLAKTKTYPAPLSIGDNDMANWVSNNLEYLEDAVGKPDTSPEHSCDHQLKDDHLIKN